MTKTRLFTVAAVAAAIAAAQLLAQPQGATTAFVGVNVIPMTSETVLAKQTVVVTDGRIVAIGAASSVQVPNGATRVDAGGKYLVPAIAEMHAHIPSGPAQGPFPEALAERTLLLYAAGGIGTIRGMLGHPEHLKYRDRVAKGELFSPRIYTSGPSFNGNSVPTTEAAIAAVEAQKKAGYDLLKIHPGVKRDVFDALAAKAHELKIPFAGHVPLDVGLHRALEARYRSIDHVDGYVEALSDKPTASQMFGVNLVSGTIDESKIPALVKATKDAGTWIVPTQVLFDSLLGPDDPEEMAKWPEMKYAEPAGVVQKWVAQKQQMTGKFSAADREKFLALRRRIIKALYDGGVPFALGSDAPQWWNVPGFSTHRELQSMVRAGLTPYEALRTGTANIGTYFNRTDIGTVAKGQIADLILLDANPLQDIANSTRIAGVMLNGRWVTKAELDKRLEAGL
jgi:imidazolonepropionase-like amidohydrolase